MNELTRVILYKMVIDSLEKIHRCFEENELAFLSYQHKIEDLLRLKLVWLLQSQLDSNNSFKGKYLVRSEWSPNENGGKKCDFAVLKQATHNYERVIAMFELKYHSHQKQETEYVNWFKNDWEKMIAFADEEHKNNNSSIDLYYIFFQQIHLNEISTFDNAFVKSYRKDIDKYRTNSSDLENELNSLNDYWKSIPSLTESYHGGTHKVVDVFSGEYFGHKSILKAVIWNETISKSNTLQL